MIRNFSDTLIDEMVRKEARIKLDIDALVNAGKTYTKAYDRKVRELQNVQSRLAGTTGVA